MGCPQALRIRGASGKLTTGLEAQQHRALRGRAEAALATGTGPEAMGQLARSSPRTLHASRPTGPAWACSASHRSLAEVRPPAFLRGAVGSRSPHRSRSSGQTTADRECWAIASVYAFWASVRCWAAVRACHSFFVALRFGRRFLFRPGSGWRLVIPFRCRVVILVGFVHEQGFRRLVHCAAGRTKMEAFLD